MANTLLEILETRGRDQADREALTFDGTPLSFGELWLGIERFACLLVRRGLKLGDRVVIAVPNSLEFFPVFYGVQRAGGVAVPVFPDSGVDRIFEISDLCRATAVVTPSSVEEGRRADFERLAAERNQLLLVPEDADKKPTSIEALTVDTDSVAFIQYTSGSTGDPKGVQLSHGNLLTNVKQMIEGMKITSDDFFVSWLPVYHDMGLILMTMAPFVLAARLVLLPTTMRSIQRWIGVISEHRATFTAAPDFAYRLALRYVRDPSCCDLSCLRVALNAAEPVRSRTIEDFEQKFALPPTMAPAYGLAEATVGVSMWPPQTPYKQDENGIVSVGPPFPDIELAIVRNGAELGPGEPGEIVVRSPANTRGYYSNPAATERLFDEPGAIRTGDHGYLDSDGNLYILGRIKNIIIQAGRNIAPQEVEEAVERLSFVRRSAAVGIDRGGPEGEQIYVFAELRPKEKSDAQRLPEVAIEVVQSVQARIGLRPGRVYLAQPKTIPMTHNGKVQHTRLKELYLSGALRDQGLLLYPDY